MENVRVINVSERENGLRIHVAYLGYWPTALKITAPRSKYWDCSNSMVNRGEKQKNQISQKIIFNTRDKANATEKYNTTEHRDKH